MAHDSLGARHDAHHAPHRVEQRADAHGGAADPHHEDDAARRALHERAAQLGATADELEAALDTLAQQAEAVLHRLRGGRLH